jgi:alkylation response protein AidB-like acyl-CoA dehydrogenase
MATSPSSAAATDDPTIQVQYGELVAELAASLALALARAVDDRLQEALDQTEALTADATRTALAVTNKIFVVTGSRATRPNTVSISTGATYALTHCKTPCSTKRARSANISC